MPKINLNTPVLIAGATGSGKSDLALALAEAEGRVVVNADALQVYDCWSILSARPERDEMRGVPHLLYGHVAAAEDYSVGRWLAEVQAILERHLTPAPILVGGTGLYFTCLTEGLAEIPPIDPVFREKSEARLARGAEGLAALLEELSQGDPATYGRIDRNNPKRVQRAWEVWQATGRGLVDWQQDGPPPLLPGGQAATFVLDGPRDWLQRRLEARFQMMVEKGALMEVSRNLALLETTRPAAQAIGARELAGYLGGKTTLEAAIDAANISTRQYAKRQRSWFRNRMKSWTFLPLCE